MERADAPTTQTSAETELTPISTRRRLFSAGAMTTALGAGIGETLVQVLTLADPAEAFAGLTVRIAIYAVVATLIIFLARGSYFARMVLIFAMSTLGLASLVAEPLAWLFTEPDLSALVASIDVWGIAVIVLRVIHLVAVVAAVIAMIRMGLRPVGDRARRGAG